MKKFTCDMCDCVWLMEVVPTVCPGCQHRFIGEMSNDYPEVVCIDAEAHAAEIKMVGKRPKTAKCIDCGRRVIRPN